MRIDFRKTILAFAGILSISVLSPLSSALAQAPQVSAPSSVLPTGGGAALLDPSDTIILLLDHQAGLFQTIKDIGVAELRSNIVMLAKLATLMKIPVGFVHNEGGSQSLLRNLTIEELRAERLKRAG